MCTETLHPTQGRASKDETTAWSLPHYGRGNWKWEGDWSVSGSQWYSGWSRTTGWWRKQWRARDTVMEIQLVPPCRAPLYSELTHNIWNWLRCIWLLLEYGNFNKSVLSTNLFCTALVWLVFVYRNVDWMSVWAYVFVCITEILIVSMSAWNFLLRFYIMLTLSIFM